MKNFAIVILLSCWIIFGCSSQSTDENISIDFNELATDAESIYWSAGTFKELKNEKIALNNSLESLSKLLNYRRDMFPLSIKEPTEANKKVAEEQAIKIKEAITNLQKALSKIDVQPKNLNAKFRINALHPGSMYPIGKEMLCNQPYAKTMEEIQLQDYPFLETVSYDKDFYSMGKCLPNLKSVVAFGAEIDDDLLSKMNIHQIKNLQILELSENNITDLPANFNELNKLEYLDLRSNNLQNLPKGLENIKSLKYINLKNNPIDNRQIDEITNRFKGAVIEF